MTRGEIIAKLAAAFGPHRSYDSATRSYLPDGHDAEGGCMISEPQVFMQTVHVCPDDAPCDCRPTPREENMLRPLTYGEVADALLAPDRAGTAVGSPCPACGGIEGEKGGAHVGYHESGCPALCTGHALRIRIGEGDEIFIGTVDYGLEPGDPVVTVASFLQELGAELKRRSAS